MSSRALRKLQREQDLKSNGSDTAVVDEDDDTPDNAVCLEAKDFKPVKAANPFDLLNEGSNDEGTNDNIDHEEDENKSSVFVSTKKRKKKKKSKDVKTIEESLKLTDEDDIDASVRAVNDMLGCMPSSVSANSQRLNGSVETNTKSLLFVEHRYLNPDNEVRRLFGTRVVQMDQSRRRRNQHRARNSFLARPRDDWQVHRKTGLSMKLVNLAAAEGGNHFVFEHSKFYQKIQFEFLNAVESLEPQNVVNLCNEFPFHIDTLLQVSEICKMSEDRQAAAEMIERALYVFENSFHPLFSLTQGTSRLQYKHAENRSFFLALWRNMITIGRKGCYRTALEYCKLILSLDPDVDPLCIVLMIDFYALRSEQYSYLIRMYSEWESHRNLSQLPNFAFSVPLAMFHHANAEGAELQQADEKLQTALLMFPGILMPLVDKCGVAVDASVKHCDYFSTTEKEPDSLIQLEMLYIGRCESCWKEPPVMAWLERNVRLVVERLNSGTIEKKILDQYNSCRQTRYRRTPRNISRHIVLSEIKEATAALSPEITLSPILSYDPLPPTDSVSGYLRPPPRPTRAQQEGNPLAMFFRSLAPTFNPQEPVVPEAETDDDAAQGAAGGANLRQGVTALMDVMRDLLNNIRFIPPPVENQQNDDADQQDDDVVDDNEWED